MNILTYLYQLLLTYWSDALLVIVVVAGLAILYRNGKKELVKTIIKNFVVQAEKGLGSATGSAKYNEVISNLYASLPLILKLLFSRATLDKYIDEAVTWLKLKLQDPDITLLSYADEALVKATEAAPIDPAAIL